MGNKWSASDFQNTKTTTKNTTNSNAWSADDFTPKPTTKPAKTETAKQKSDNINSLMNDLFVDNTDTKQTTNTSTPSAFKSNAIKDTTFKSLATSNATNTTKQKGTVKKAVPTNTVKAAIINTNPKNIPLAFKPNTIIPTSKPSNTTLPQATTATQAIKTQNKKDVKQQAIDNQNQKVWNASDEKKLADSAKNANPIYNLITYGTTDTNKIESDLKNVALQNYKTFGTTNKKDIENQTQAVQQYEAAHPNVGNAPQQGKLSAFVDRTLGNIANAEVGQEINPNNPASSHNAGTIGNAVSDFLGMAGYGLNPYGLGEAPMNTLGRLVGTPVENAASKLIGKGENSLASKVGNMAVKKAIQSQAVNKVVNPILSSAARGAAEMSVMNGGLTAMNGGNAKQVVQSGLEGLGQGALWGGGLKGLGIAGKGIANKAADINNLKPANLTTKDIAKQNFNESTPSKEILNGKSKISLKNSNFKSKATTNKPTTIETSPNVTEKPTTPIENNSVINQLIEKTPTESNQTANKPIGNKPISKPIIPTEKIAETKPSKKPIEKIPVTKTTEIIPNKTQPIETKPTIKTSEEWLNSLSKDDINYNTAYNAHRNVSFDPERRAKATQEEYISEMKAIHDKLSPLAKTEEQKALLVDELEKYRQNYLKHMNNILSARSRTASSAITGGSNFPKARNDKAINAEHNKVAEFLDWHKKAEKSIKNKLDGLKPEEVKSNEEFERLRKEALHTIGTLKGIEKGGVGDPALFRKNLADKLKRSYNNGNTNQVIKTLNFIKENQSKHLKNPVFSDRNKIWEYLDKPIETPKAHEINNALENKYKGASIIGNKELDRVQIKFDEIPSNEVTTDLKSSGWHYSGKEKAWQRKLTPNAEYSAKKIIEKHFGENKATSEPIKASKSDEVIRKSVNTNSPIDKIDIQQGTGETKSRKEIVDNLFETLGIPHRVGRIRGSKGILGIYKTKSEVIRTRFDSDLSVIPHEVGHHLDKLYDFTEKAMNDRYIKAEMMKSGAVQGKIQKMSSPKDQIGEGLADFVKYYISKPEYAKKEFPKFYDHFEKTVDPDIKTALLDYRNDYKKYINADPEKRLNAQMSINQKTSKIEKLKAMFNKNKLSTDWLDSLNPIRQMVEENNPKVKPTKNPYKVFKNMSGWENKAEAILNYGIKDKSGRQMSEGLASILNPVKSDINEFRNYIVAKRVLEKNAQGIRTGVHIEDAEYTVNKYSNNAKFNEAFKKLQTFQDAMLQNAVDSGLISGKQYQAMKDSNKDYVPFYRVFDDTKGGFVGKDKIAGATSPIRRMKGSERQIIDPLESIIKNVYLMTNSIERNNAMNVLADYAQSMNGMGKYLEEVPPKMMPQHMQIADVKKQLESLGMDVSEESADGMLTMFSPLFKGDPKNCIIPIMRDGKTKLYQLDPDIYRAVMGCDKEQTNFIMKLLSSPAKTLRAGAVLSPNFAVRNPIRDTFDAGIYSRYGFKPVIDTVRGLYHVIGKDDIYQTYMESGAGFSNAVSLDRNRLQENLNKLLSDSTVIGDLKNFAHSPLLPLRMLSEVMEEATRVGEFSLGLKKEGNTPSGRLNASLAAKDVTLNFGEAGNKAKELNKVIAFFNANIKGKQKIYNELFNPKTPLKRRAQVMTKAMAMVTVPTIINWIYVNSDEKRKKVYQEEPEWRKQIFWVIPTDDSVIYIPKPPAIGILFGSSVEKALDYANNNDKSAPGKLANQILEDNKMTLLPTALTPMLENITNHSFFYGNTLVPDSLSGVSPKNQYTKSTTNAAKIISDSADKIPFINISPIQVDNFVRGYFGGTGTLAMNTASMATGQNLFSKKTNIPVVGAFVNDQFSNPQSVNDFYDNKNKLTTKYKDFKADSTSGMNGKEYGLYKAFIKSGTVITNIKKAITTLQSSKDPDKDKKIKQLNNTILEIAQNMNKYYEKINK